MDTLIVFTNWRTIKNGLWYVKNFCWIFRRSLGNFWTISEQSLWVEDCVTDSWNEKKWHNYVVSATITARVLIVPFSRPN